MSETVIVVNTVVAVLATVVLIVRFRLNPVISLVIGAVYLGLTAGLGVEGTVDAVTGGFGEILADVGLLIAFARSEPAARAALDMRQPAFGRMRAGVRRKTMRRRADRRPSGER